ncbi:GMC family oxidoreductase [Pseudomonas syringae]|uniref:GMC family oxidoreductase n=4 Tax=Pseudomonas syringae TaxID=317 RepID=UPI000CD347C3|nr:GMC family oxidoreductase N-terminal domain-containing protein [Pseudomonas syringae]MCF5209434.1 GMC family oxidoreductase [Pseudomonas syringae]MCF5212509.1 GMC family oxidoreductase [Pseudomonas syringae]MCF5220866.1 GMC family oxidoreductase [Pseudomonas syringae]MCF5265688.1 GMC family oxidoreductase [Pseudomonas syringae]MCF5301933.1 GMC family oxidoreductase [Pseudomonas syringae]
MTSSCVVQAQRADQHSAQVLLIEAGEGYCGPEVAEPAQWPMNLGSTRDWAFEGQANPHLNGRRLSLNMGKGLCGGSSINVMVWARGHRCDWDHFATESGDSGWGYDSVLNYYRRIENWQGSPDATRRGSGGPVHVEQPATAQPLAWATLEAASRLGIPRFDSPNGEMMEGPGGIAITDLRINQGRRESVYDSYVRPRLHSPNLTVLTGALVTRVLLVGTRAIGVEVVIASERQCFYAAAEVILSMGAVQTPKVLMQSGIGPQKELHNHGIAMTHHLPGVGENLQDHLAFGCTWEYLQPQAVGSGGCETTLYWKSDSRLEAPDLLQCQLQFAVPSPPEVAVAPPQHGWTMFAGLAQPASRGRVRLSGAGPLDAPLIEPNSLSAPEDMKAAYASIDLCRALGNSAAFNGLVKREVVPGPKQHRAMEQFIRNAAVTYWHPSCTAKMGRDAMSVVDHQLRVYGIEHLRIADASIMPRITTGNTMAPCVVIGERAADLVLASQGVKPATSES